jgi:hypothetical protein
MACAITEGGIGNPGSCSVNSEYVAHAARHLPNHQPLYGSIPKPAQWRMIWNLYTVLKDASAAIASIIGRASHPGTHTGDLYLYLWCYIDYDQDAWMGREGRGRGYTNDTRVGLTVFMVRRKQLLTENSC